jgi:hypothetical protein
MPDGCHFPVLSGRAAWHGFEESGGEQRAFHYPSSPSSRGASRPGDAAPKKRILSI